MTYHRFVTILTRRLSLVEQELLTLPEHLSSPQVFSRVRVTRYLDLCVCFVGRCLFFCTFPFGHCVVCSSAICPFGIFKLFLIVFIYCEQLIFVDQYLKVDVYILKTLEAFKNGESALNETNMEISIQLILDINELEKANAILRKKLALTKTDDDY